MNAAITSIRKKIINKNIYIADADVSTCILKYRYGWEQINNMFGTEAWIPNLAGLILIPTFTGDMSHGHWHLTIFSTLQSNMKGYMIDSLGYSDNSMKASQKILRNLFPNLQDIEYIPSPTQIETKCGARTF